MDASWDGGVLSTIYDHCDLTLDLWPHFLKNYIWSISLILFEVGIPIWCVDASLDGGVSHTTLNRSSK